MYTTIDQKPSNIFTSYSTAIFNNSHMTRCFIHNARDNSFKGINAIKNGELKPISSKKFIELYKNASINIDSNFGISLLVPTDTGYLIHGCGGLAHEALLFYNNDVTFCKKLPKVGNIPPKMYRYSNDTIYIQYPNGKLVRIRYNKGNREFASTNPYAGEPYELYRIEINDNNTTIFESRENSIYHIMNEHTSMTGTLGIIRKGPSCYNEYRSYYEWIINKLYNSEIGENQIEYSTIAYKILYSFGPLGQDDSVIKYTINDQDRLDELRSKLHILSYDDMYNIFNDQINHNNDRDGSVTYETLPFFITKVDTKEQNLLRFIPVSTSNTNDARDLYGKEVEFDPTVFDESFPNKGSMSYHLAKNQEKNALNAMVELYNNYLYDKNNTSENSKDYERYQWMFYDNAVLLLEQDDKYWYINIIKYSDRYDRAQYRQVIRKDQIKNLIVSYSNNILTLKFSDINSAEEKPTMVRIYDLNSTTPHNPIYSADEVYSWNRSLSANNTIITDKFNLESTYYSNGMLFKTESDQSYGHTDYNKYDNVPDIMLFTGERLNRINFDQGKN